jgi:hypothetical protein
MKLPKHNSEPLHVKAMKLKFILPLYLALASATFCGRKITEEKEIASPAKLTPTAAIASTGKVTGTLELEPETNTIYADIWLKVSSHDFKFAHDYMPLQTDNGHKGIAFRYYDTVDNAPDNGKDTVQIHVVFNFINEMEWRVDDTIRVMSLDEDKKDNFEDLKPYFLKRMDFFGNEPCNYEQLLAFNGEWNSANPENQVTTAKEDAEEAPEKSNKKKRQVKMTPKLTKDDGVLTLRLKR